MMPSSFFFDFLGLVDGVMEGDFAAFFSLAQMIGDCAQPGEGGGDSEGGKSGGEAPGKPAMESRGCGFPGQKAAARDIHSEKADPGDNEGALRQQ